MNIAEIAPQTETQASAVGQPTREYIRRWKLLQSGYDGSVESCSYPFGARPEKWKPGGDWHELPPHVEVRLCVRGYHSSETLWDASHYVAGDVVGLVEVDGECDRGGGGEPDKQAHQRMRLVRAWRLTPEFYGELAERLEGVPLDEWLMLNIGFRLTAYDVMRAIREVREAKGYLPVLPIKESFKAVLQDTMEDLLFHSGTAEEISGEGLNDSVSLDKSDEW